MMTRYGTAALIQTGDPEISSALARGIIAGKAGKVNRTRAEWMKRVAIHYAIGRGEITPEYRHWQIFDAEMRYGESLEETPFKALREWLLVRWAVFSLAVVAVIRGKQR